MASLGLTVQKFYRSVNLRFGELPVLPESAPQGLVKGFGGVYGHGYADQNPAFLAEINPSRDARYMPVELQLHSADILWPSVLRLGDFKIAEIASHSPVPEDRAQGYRATVTHVFENLFKFESNCGGPERSRAGDRLAPETRAGEVPSLGRISDLPSL